MGSAPAPLLADLSLYLMEKDLVESGNAISAGALILRYLDDVLSVNASYKDVAKDAYDEPLKFLPDPPKNGKLAFLDLELEVTNGKFKYRTFDKRRSFPFNINSCPHFDSCVSVSTHCGVGIGQFVRYYRTNYAYADFVYNCKMYIETMRRRNGRTWHARMIANRFLKKHFETHKWHVEKSRALRDILW